MPFQAKSGIAGRHGKCPGHSQYSKTGWEKQGAITQRGRFRRFPKGYYIFKEMSLDESILFMLRFT
jgi:hypothetical protein